MRTESKRLAAAAGLLFALCLAHAPLRNAALHVGALSGISAPASDASDDPTTGAGALAGGEDESGELLLHCAWSCAVAGAKRRLYSTPHRLFAEAVRGLLQPVRGPPAASSQL